MHSVATAVGTGSGRAGGKQPSSAYGGRYPGLAGRSAGQTGVEQ